MDELDKYMHLALALIKDCAENWESLRREQKLQSIQKLLADVEQWRTDAQRFLQPLEQPLEEISARPLRSRHVPRGQVVKRGDKRKIQGQLTRPSRRRFSLTSPSPLFVTVDSDVEMEQPAHEGTSSLAGTPENYEAHQGEGEISADIRVDNRIEGLDEDNAEPAQNQTLVQTIERSESNNMHAQPDETARLIDEFFGNFSPVEPAIGGPEEAYLNENYHVSEDETSALSRADDQILEDCNDHEIDAFFEEAIHFPNEFMNSQLAVENGTGALSTGDQTINNSESYNVLNAEVRFPDGFQSPLSDFELSASRSLSPTKSNTAHVAPDMLPSAQTTTEHCLSFVSSSCSHFRSPHESLLPQESSEEMPLASSRLLSPLLHNKPLIPQLFHALLYQLVPATVHIIELSPRDFDTFVSKASNFIVIVSQNTPFLILGVENRKEIIIVGPEDEHCIFVTKFCDKHQDWTYKYRNPVCPNVESTLSSVYLAETVFKDIPATSPSQQYLQLRYLLELLAPYERRYVLQHLGSSISEKCASCQREDGQAPPLQGSSDASDISIPVIPDFNRDALVKVFSCKPEIIQLIRAIRILQCIFEIGSPSVLKRLILDKPLQANSDTGSDIEMLLDIHRSLDKQAKESQLSVSKNRHLTYCYFETYQTAVKALQVKKKQSRNEKSKVTMRKRSANYKNSESTDLSTPMTDSITATYNMLTEVERDKRAEDMVKLAIVRSIHNSCGANENEIHKIMTLYLRVGRRMHYLLHGSLHLGVGLLLLFPGDEQTAPLLNISSVELELDDRGTLLEPITVQDINKLKEAEAIWFGKALQYLRPDLLEPVPKDTLELLSSSESKVVINRDPKLYKGRPLQFFA